MIPAYRKQDFPENTEPVYDFHVNNGKICVNLHTRYVRTDTPEHRRIKFSYRIHADNRVITKDSNQMDRYLNGHLFTLNPDTQRAKEIIVHYYKEKLALAKISIAQYEEALSELESGGDSP